MKTDISPKHTAGSGKIGFQVGGREPPDLSYKGFLADMYIYTHGMLLNYSGWDPTRKEVMYPRVHTHIYIYDIHAATYIYISIQNTKICTSIYIYIYIYIYFRV